MTGRAKITVRLVGADDAGLFGYVADDVFDHAIDDSRLTAYLTAPDHLMAIAATAAAADDDAPVLIIGQARALVLHHPDGPPQLYVDNLGVAPAWRRQGIARRLLSRLADAGRARGCHERWIATEPDNRAACSLYDSMGLRRIDAVVFDGPL